MNPGIYHDLPWEEYHAIRLPSPSTFKHGRRSMKRLKRAIDGELDPKPETVKIGTGVHCSLFGETERLAIMPRYELDPRNKLLTYKNPPAKMRKQNDELSKLGERWVALCKEHGLPDDHLEPILIAENDPESPKATKFYKDARKRFEAENVNKAILTADDWETVSRIRGELVRNDVVLELLNRSQTEVSIIADIPDIDGKPIRTKTRLDLLDVPGMAVSELKTMEDIAPSALYRKCKTMGYFFQFAWHVLALRYVPGGFEVQEYNLIAAENTGDFDTGAIEIPRAVTDQHEESVRRVLRDYRHAKRDNFWGGLYPSKAQLTVPNWDMTEEVEFEG